MDVHHSFLYCFKSGHLYYCKSLAKITRRTNAISKKISNIMTRKLTGANPIIPFGVVWFQTVLFLSLFCVCAENEAERPMATENVGDNLPF